MEPEAAERMVRLIKKICRRGTICSVDRNTFGPCGDLLYNSHTTFSCSAHLNLSPAQKRGPFLALAGLLTSTILLPCRIAPELLSYKSVTWLGADRAEESPVSSSTPLAIFAIRPLLPVRSHSLVRNLKELFRLSTVRAQGSHRRPITGVVRFPSFLCGPSFPQIGAFRRGSF